jgi:hypothetical protein
MATQESVNPPSPTVITLDNTNSLQILSQYIELAQSKGAYLLAEAEILKRAADFLLNKVADAELNDSNARQLLVQGVHKGQRHGCYTLNDAALLSKVVNFVSANSGVVPSQPLVQQAPSLVDDLADLAEPIPLKPREV